MIFSLVDLRTIDVSVAFDLVDLLFKGLDGAERGPEEADKELIAELEFV